MPQIECQAICRARIKTKRTRILRNLHSPPLTRVRRSACTELIERYRSNVFFFRTYKIMDYVEIYGFSRRLD